MARTRKSLERRLGEERKSLSLIEMQIAKYTDLEAPIHLLKQRDDTKERITQIEEQLRHIPSEPSPHVPSLTPALSTAGCVIAVVLIAGALTILLFLGPVAGRYLAWLRSPTPTSTPTKTPATVLSPTITGTPTLTPVPSPTPAPTPYYVEIVVDASERMSAEFEGGITKIESAWQTAGTIARTRAQRGQFVSIRTFGGGGEQTDMGCFESCSVLSFTDQDSEIKAHLTTIPIPGGQAAVVTALTDASAELMAYENIGREIILLTGGDDECGSALLTFYGSENRSLWTQTFVVLFAGQDFGPFIELRARGADINYSLVKNAAQAQEVAEKVAAATPVPVTMVPTPVPPPPTSATGDTPRPTSTPKPPPPPPIGGIATATHTPTPTATQSPTYTSTPTDTPTSTETATCTPTTTPRDTPTSTPTTTPSPSPTTIPTATSSATPTATPPSFQWIPLLPQNDVYAQNCPLISQTREFYGFEWNQATVSANLVSEGHTGQGLKLDFAYDLPSSYSGWEVRLGDSTSGIDLTLYNSLTFYIRGAQGGETPNVWLMMPVEVFRRYYRDVEIYRQVTNQWQEVVIPLVDFTTGIKPEEEIDLHHIHKIQIVFEWYPKPTSGTIYIDDLCVQ